jgi:diguanylate cyclase (GGDEF)-like protein
VSAIDERILEQVLAAAGEPIVIVRVDHPDWPVALASESFATIGGDSVDRPFADVVEQLVGRDLALEVSRTLRSRQETSFPVEIGGREYLLALKPLGGDEDAGNRYYAVYFRGGGGVLASSEMHHALLRAKRDLRDLSREDPVTGLLNGRAFREVLKHDWAVASRQKTVLALVVFTLDEFGSYIDVFGRHAADSCLRRVGQAVRRCLRRASDVVGRLDGAELVVLSHAADVDAVGEFAGRIAASVRELGLHHPRSSVSRFVTVSYRVGVSIDPGEVESAIVFLDELLASDPDRS